jgi:hypothetical protein
MLEWAARQPWTSGQLKAAAPANAELLPSPSKDVAAFIEHVRFEFGYHVAFSREPDGGFSWALIADDGTALKSGVSDSWDDARLALIEGLAPPELDSLSENF